MLSDEIKRYLPQYLSAKSTQELFEQLDQFPTDGTKDTVYTSALRWDGNLYQGDGIADINYMDFPNPTIRRVNVILLSNTCDMQPGNKRINPCRIMYAPLLNYEKYSLAIRKNFPEKAENHLKALKQQHITQAMYLPKGAGLKNDAVVFFDRAISLPLRKGIIKEFQDKRIFTLSNFGFYLFLLKLSMHFTRIQEKVDRNEGIDVGAKQL